MQVLTSPAIPEIPIRRPIVRRVAARREPISTWLSGMATRRPKHPGGRPAIWGERTQFTLRPPKDVKRSLIEAAETAGLTLSEYASILLAARVGVDLPTSTDGKQLQLAFDDQSIPAPPEDIELYARPVPQQWGKRDPFNIRVPVRVKGLLEVAATAGRIPLAEFCVLVLATEVGIELPNSRSERRQDEPSLALGA